MERLTGHPYGVIVSTSNPSTHRLPLTGFSFYLLIFKSTLKSRFYEKVYGVSIFHYPFAFLLKGKKRYD